MHSQLISHWQAVKRILHYLKHTMHYGLTLSRSTSSTLAAFSDVDWAGCPDDRKYIGGYRVFLGLNLISYSSKKQSTIAHSSTEVVYKSLVNAACECLWLQQLLSELDFFFAQPLTLYYDNLGATYLSVNPIFYSRTKHVNIDFHFVRDRIQAKAL